MNQSERANKIQEVGLSDRVSTDSSGNVNQQLKIGTRRLLTIAISVLVGDVKVNGSAHIKI